MITIKDSTAHVVFDSLEELKQKLPTFVAQKNSDIWRSEVMHNSWGGPRWFGTANVTEAFKCVENGWPELTKKLQPMVETLRASLNLDTVLSVDGEVRKRKRKRGDHGDTLDMTRVWSGNLDTAWERPVKFPRLAAHQRYATIYVDLAASSAVTNEQMLWGAALSMCVIDTLTRMGLSTEIWAGSSASGVYPGGHPKFTSTGVRVKEFSQPLNEDRLAVMLSATFFRTWGFGMLMAPDVKASSSLGYPFQAGLPIPLAERRERGERVFRITGAQSQHQAEQIMKLIIDDLTKKKEEAA